MSPSRLTLPGTLETTRMREVHPRLLNTGTLLPLSLGGYLRPLEVSFSL